MSPDSLETRTGRLETAVARLEQRTEDLRSDVQLLMPLTVAVAEIRGSLNRVQDDVRRAIGLIEDRKQIDAEAQRQAMRDARNNRWALYAGAILVALSAVGNIVVQLVVPT